MARPRRLPAFDYRGSYVYSLTFCTHRRRRFFEHEAIVHQVRLAIDSAATHAFAVLAYTFMPDHVHLLVQGLGDESCLPSFVKLARQRGSVATRGLRDGPLWQDGYFERTLRRDEDVVSVARYLAANPVRAGLVDEAGDWPIPAASFSMRCWSGGDAASKDAAYVPTVMPHLKMRPTYPRYVGPIFRSGILPGATRCSPEKSGAI